MKRCFLSLMLAAAALLPVAGTAADAPEKRRDQLLDNLPNWLNAEPFGPEYAAALKRGDRAEALRLVAGYYRRKPENPYLAGLAQKGYDAERARRAVRGEVTVVNVPYAFPDGRIDFRFDATAARPPQNHEWLWQLNRMWFWNDMAADYYRKKDEACARAFNRQVRDWILQVPAPAADDNGDRPGSAWRSIEAGIRLGKPWPLAFEVFRNSPEVPDETLLLMVASMHQQARHLMRHGSATRPNRFMGNWIAMEMSGVYAFASFFPEFREAAAMRREAMNIITDALRRQLLPDGWQNELSPDYHAVVFHNNTTVWHIARQYGRLGELPQDFLPLLEKAAEAYLAMAAPGLTQPRTNDCYTLRTKSVLQPAAQLFPHRQDFRWAATGRAEGTPPAGGTASRYLPWGGFAVMRSDWGPEAAYLCFDVGPLGRAHEHQDKLNINLYKGSEELIFDDGGGQYDRSPHYFHARSGAGHNTLLVDGLAQFRREPKTAEAPVEAGWISNERFDYAAADYRDGFGPEEAKFAVHRREVLFAKPDFFCVADTVNSRDGRAHDYELLFQLDTLKLKPVDELPGAVISDFGRNYDILIVPLYPEGLEVSRVSGQKEPRLAGWYAGRNDRNLHPATTLSMTAKRRKEFRFATLLFPLKSGGAKPQITRLEDGRCRVVFNGRSVTFDPGQLRNGVAAR